MTNMQLLEAIGMLNEDIIADADAPVEKRAKILPWRQIGTVAACLCIAVGVFLVPLVGRQMNANDGDSSIVTQTGGANNTTTGVASDGTTTPFDAATVFPVETTTSSPEWVTEPAETTASPEPTTTSPSDTTLPHGLTTGQPDPTAPGTSGTQEPLKTVDAVTPTQSLTTTTIHGTSKPSTECIGPSEGVLIYAQDFDDLTDTEDQTVIMKLLGLTQDALRQESSRQPTYGAYSVSDVRFAIEGGRLYIDNHDETPVEGRGQDAYFRIAALNNDYMKYYVSGKYTLEYELEYVTAADNAYVALITEYSEDGRCYNIFAPRADGRGLHACHFYDMWKYFTEENANIPSNVLTEKLTGIRADEEQPLSNVRVTVRLQWDPEWGHTAYLKTSAMTDFVMISEPSIASEGIMYLGWDGWAVALKVGGAVDAYMDNIRIWTGWGEPNDGQE